jgi:putative lipoprotein
MSELVIPSKHKPLLGLFLALLLAWPAAAPAQTPRDDALRVFLQSTFADARAEWSDTSYVSAFADLNGDGRDEALVSLYSGLFCGSGGCALYIYTPAGASWREVAEITIVNAPVRLLASSHRGWRDLAVHVSGGGALPSDARLTFDGRTYASNPSLAPRLRGRIAGRVLISDDAQSRPLF